MKQHNWEISPNLETRLRPCLVHCLNMKYCHENHFLLYCIAHTSNKYLSIPPPSLLNKTTSKEPKDVESERVTIQRFFSSLSIFFCKDNFLNKQHRLFLGSKIHINFFLKSPRLIYNK